ncbi:hypothetical protein F4780DRAFT_790484 [Xylariomycetidae sp. FL0641]|nr:hypothetical protein F4780DRAFT_790484 [Xylariomycetidae sp. FL0641]
MNMAFTMDPVAIVGLSLRFPQDAVSEESFWDIIMKGESTMTEVPKDRYNIQGHHVPGSVRPGTSAARGGHFLKSDVAAFDARFFNMGGNEAKAMDPQLRILLESTYHALESAGIPHGSVAGTRTSVYVGNLRAEYASLYGDDDEINAKYQATGTSGAMLSNRISWFYDFQGPSLTLDTACSSSLVCLHLACDSLLEGESEMSLVCGAQLHLEPRSMSVQATRLNFLSPDSHCYSFDDRANGYSRGEGFGVLVLKRLSKALEDGDTVRAVIRGTATNQDGHTPSVTQPSPDAQAALIRKAYEPLSWDYAKTGYFEAHGTGTAVGDPIEARGISLVFSEHRSADNPLVVGSVKANIGHLEATAGVAGVIKAVLSMENGAIAPNAMLKRLNPAIPADDWHLKFPTTAMPWPHEGLRRASVNSFGFGGTNAHVILDDAFHYMESRGLRGNHNTRSPADRKRLLGDAAAQPAARTDGAEVNGESEERQMLFLLSAAEDDGVQRSATDLASHLEHLEVEDETQYLSDLAFTLGTRRSIYPARSFATGSSFASLRESLSHPVQKPLRASSQPSLRFIFTGQGAQWVGMGRELMQYPIFRKSLERADAFTRSLGSPWSMIDELYGPQTLDIDDPQLAQPLCTAVQIALADLLSSWGIRPEAVVGHSSGEIAAAYSAGALTAESAWRVAYFRGQVASTLADSQGGMLAAALSEAELAPYIAAVAGDDAGGLTCACVNSPRNTTVSGRKRYVDELAASLEAGGVFARMLNVPVAYHSPQMLRVAEAYRAALGDALESQSKAPGEAPVTFISSVTGAAAAEKRLCTAEYWISNLVSQVKFSEALGVVCSMSEPSPDRKIYLLEVGPHPAMERPVKETLEGRTDYVYDYTLRRGQNSTSTAIQMAGRLFCNGHPINIAAVNSVAHNRRRRPRVPVGLPAYPFNHSTRYWLESRLIRNHRFRAQPRHDFLGNPSRDWNPLEPKWRFTIRISDLPWVADHNIGGTVLYPAAGMLVMVVEGVRSLTADLPGVTGFRLRDVSIVSALLVPPTEDGVEAQLSMHSHDNSQSTKTEQSWDFHIYTVSGSEWRLHCSGTVCYEQDTTTDVVVSEPPAVNGVPAHGEEEAKRKSNLASAQFYDDFAKKGAKFGPAFQSLEDIAVDAGARAATASVDFGEWARQTREGNLSRHVIHPCTLDSLFQAIFAATHGEWEELPPMVPTQVSEAYFSTRLLAGAPDDRLHLQGEISCRNTFSVDGSSRATASGATEPLVVIQGCRLSGLSVASHAGDGSAELPTLFHQLDWKPDIDFLSPREIEQICEEATHGVPSGGIGLQKEVVSRHFMSVALEQLQGSPPYKSSKPHFQKYVEWLHTFLDRETQSTAKLIKGWEGFDKADLRPGLLDEYAARSLADSNLVEFGQNLVSVLKEELDPLDLLFNRGILDSFYQSPVFSFTAQRLGAYMDLLGHKNSDLKIIEVGAGTGSTSTVVLETLYQQGSHPGSSPRFNQFDFTDISPSFFAKAQERYAQYGDRVRYKILDLERDPIEQGFEAHSYDVVVAASVLHATKNIGNTLKNVIKLLKPGGQLVFSEPTNTGMATIPFFSGVLSGWWLSEESFRPWGPLLSKELWGEALKNAGFDGLTVALADDAEETHALSLMVATSPNPRKNDPIASRVIVAGNAEAQRDLATKVQEHLKTETTGPCDIMTFEDFGSLESQYDQCICLIELEQPIMSHLNAVQFTALQRMFRTCKQIIWVNDSCGGTPKTPEAAMIGGFGKTVIRENPRLTFTHLNVETGPSSHENILRVIDQNSKGSASDRNTSKLESDYVEQGGVIFIPRAVEAPHVNKLLHSEIHGLNPEPLEVDGKAPSDPLELRFSPGRLDSFHFGPDAGASLPLPDDQVEVAVKATGINFKDVMVALNQVTSDYIGQEFAGEVTRVGAGMKDRFSPGDRVCGITNGTFRTYVRSPRSRTIPMPATMPYTEAASVPLAYATAVYGLRHLGQLKHGETVLIHAAAGAVGQAAIQLAQQVGATVLVSVSSGAKQALLSELYGLPAENFFPSRNISGGAFAAQVQRRTGGRGVDVVLNSLAGRALAETWRCLAPFGRFVEMGRRDGPGAFRSLPMAPFARNVAFCSLDLGWVAARREPLMERLMWEVEALVLHASARTCTAPRPVRVFPRSGFEAAFRLLQTGLHTGKVVVDWEAPDTIQAIPKRQLDYRFDDDATYVIAGGLGGIGRNIALWMVRNGAKHLVLLSRSGPKPGPASELVAKLHEFPGVQVYTPPCDISNIDELKKVVQHVEKTMPAIKGCIQSSMVVENRIFDEYDLPTFQASIAPKVQGTWNLDRALPRDLRFFVILASLAGVHGASSQSNYAAASAFQDAFARHRRARGEPCAALDLGVVAGVGYIAERVEAAQALALTYTDHKYLQERELHFMLRYACCCGCDPNPGSTTIASASAWPDDAQLLGGMTTPAFVRRGGAIEEHGWMRLPAFRHLYRMERHTGASTSTNTTAAQADSTGARLAAAGSLAEAADAVAAALVRRLARSLAVPAGDVDTARPPHAFGVDSLVAVELLHWFAAEVRADVPVVLILGSLSIAQLARLAAENSELFVNREGEESSSS